MLKSPGLRSDLGGKFISTQCFSRALLSHMHWKHGYFVYPHCWPRRNANILRSTQMIQLCLWYRNNSITVSMFPYSSQRQTECPIATAPYKFPLWRRRIIPIHKATVTSKVLKKFTFSGSKQHSMIPSLLPVSNKFFSFSLGARISEAVFDRLKARAKSVISCWSNPFELSIVQFQNLHHCCYFIFHHNPQLQIRIV